MVQVVLNLEVENYDELSIDSVIEHINWDALLDAGDDVIDVTSVEVENFQEI